MLKEKLMGALKEAVESYNGGLSANESLAKVAESYDFNEDQTDRLVELFNTAAAINKEKDAEDAAGSCELADKSAVMGILLGCRPSEKKASAPEIKIDALAKHASYEFYGTEPVRENETLKARRTGLEKMTKAAESVQKQSFSSEEEPAVVDELYASLDTIKQASDAAGELSGALEVAIDADARQIASFIDRLPYEEPSDRADLFKASCADPEVIQKVAAYSHNVAQATGGRYNDFAVCDTTPIDSCLKLASDMSENLKLLHECSGKQDLYAKKYAEYSEKMRIAAGFAETRKPGLSHLLKLSSALEKASFFRGAKGDSTESERLGKEAKASFDVARILIGTGISTEDLAKFAESLDHPVTEKKADLTMIPFSIDGSNTLSALMKNKSIDDENAKLMNVRRGLILTDLMMNDPIIKDADPDAVLANYRSMVMTSPRVSLDKEMARSYLRQGINSVSVSPADAKILTDVDKGINLSNVGRLTSLDSSIKDSNKD